MKLPERFLTLEPRELTDEERRLLNHVSMWGSARWPYHKRRSKWAWSFGSISSPTLYKTKREATVSFDLFCDLLRDLSAYESWKRMQESA